MRMAPSPRSRPIGFWWTVTPRDRAAAAVGWWLPSCTTSTSSAVMPLHDSRDESDCRIIFSRLAVTMSTGRRPPVDTNAVKELVSTDESSSALPASKGPHAELVGIIPGVTAVRCGSCSRGGIGLGDSTSRRGCDTPWIAGPGLAPSAAATRAVGEGCTDVPGRTAPGSGRVGPLSSGGPAPWPVGSGRGERDSAGGGLPSPPITPVAVVWCLRGVGGTVPSHKHVQCAVWPGVSVGSARGTPHGTLAHVARRAGPAVGSLLD